MRVRREAYEAQLESRLTRHDVVIADVPQIPTETLLNWAIEERQPFRSTGEGFRDALVWGTVLETAVELDAPDLIVLVTANSKDFCDRDGSLASALVADLERIGAPPTTTVAASLADALVLLEPEFSQAREAREASTAFPDVEEVSTFDPEEVLHGPVVEACEGLAGQLLASSATHTLELETLTGRRVGLNLDLPPDFQDASVYAIEPLPETLTWDAYDRYGDRMLGIATLRADLEIDGTVLAADLDDIVRRWTPSSVDEEYDDIEGGIEKDVDPRVWVTMTHQVELRFAASVGLVSHSVEGVELDSVTATPR